MKKSVLPLMIAALLSAALPAQAQTCLKTPSCAELGYSKSATDCAGKTILKCPLDTNKVYCPSYEESLKTYTQGDIYYDERGIGIGTVYSVDSTQRHGIVVISGGIGTPSEATIVCSSKNAGGLNWSVARGESACYLLSPSSYSVGINASNGIGECHSGRWGNTSMTKCKDGASCGFACEAPF